MREYELYLVIDGDAQEEETAAIIEKVTQLISTPYGDARGEVIKVEARGKRRLAYSVKRKLEGQDFVITYQCPAQALPELERAVKLDDMVLRHSNIRTGDIE